VAEQAAAVEVDGLVKRYGRTLALDGVSFAINRNETFAMLGPNGAGKTTLLHILCTILRPDGGTASVDGCDVDRNPLGARRRIGVVFQEPSLDDRLTVYENLNFHGLVYGVPTRLRRERIAEMLALVELAEWRDRLVRTLSSGMKRRLEIARALVHDAAILFLDEPTVGLDAQSRERIWTYLARLKHERGLTLVVTTHYIEEVETSDRVLVIDRGRVLAIGSPAELKAAHGRALLRIVPREDAARAEIVAAYQGVAESSDGGLILHVADDRFVDAFLARYGGRIRQMTLIEPSLESVFLTLTGRELRDQAAGARERTYAFGRRGGEHTR
jgi:ABC-2 type transport system ATP-binding protein